MIADHRPYWWFEIDEHDLPSGNKFFIAHIRFARFTPRIFRQVLAEWHDLFVPTFKHPLFAYNMENGGDTWVKFVTRLGFKRTDQLAPNGEPFFVWISDNVHVNRHEQHQLR